jgi:hypothetical protein
VPRAERRARPLPRPLGRRYRALLRARGGGKIRVGRCQAESKAFHLKRQSSSYHIITVGVPAPGDPAGGGPSPVGRQVVSPWGPSR